MIRRRIALAAAFVLAVAGISLRGGPVTWTFFWTIVLIPVTALVYIACVIASFKVYQRTDGRDMVCGEPSDFYITLTNEGFFTFSSLRLHFYAEFSSVTGIPDHLVFELPPQDSITWKTRLLCRYRGEYEVGLKQIEVTDFLGLFTVRWRIREPLNVIVAPAMIRIGERMRSEIAEESGREDPFVHIDPDVSAREYVDGDDLRFLHWKASAAMQKLMVRERTSEERNGIAILMDPCRHDGDMEVYLPLENRMIELVLAFAMYYQDKGIPADVFTKDVQLVRHAVRDSGDLEELYNAMRGYSFRETNDTEHMLGEFLDGTLAGYRQIIFILHVRNSRLDALIREINVDRAPVCVYLVNTTGQEMEAILTDRNSDAGSRPGMGTAEIDTDQRSRTVFIGTDRALKEQL